MIAAPEHDMQRGCVNDEHAEASATKDTGEVVPVADHLTSKGESKLGFDSEELRCVSSVRSERRDLMYIH